MSIRIVEELTKVSDLCPTAKVIYIVTMMAQPACIYSLAERAHVDRKTATKHCKELERRGWMRLSDGEGRIRPAAVIPVPIEAMLAMETSKIIDASHFKGEETTKVIIDWIVAPQVRLVYDSRPPFLTNPETGHNLEYDIFAPDYAWATEHHGDQHFNVTDLYPDKDQLRERKKRDLFKVALSQKNNVRLSVVTRNDLNLKAMLAAIPPDIPRRTFDPKGPYVQMFEKAGSECTRKQYWDRE